MGLRTTCVALDEGEKQWESTRTVRRQLYIRGITLLILQDLLDQVMLAAYEEKFDESLPQVDYYWLDELVEDIEFGKDALMTVRWRDGDDLTVKMPVDHEQLLPMKSAERYNAFLNKVRAGKTKVKGKFVMGL